MPRTVLIVDDHPSFRRSARLVLERAGWSVSGEAGDGARALAAVRELNPDLVLLDVQLPDIDGIDVATRLTAGEDGPMVVLVSSHDAAEYGALVDDCGARGFIPKGELTAKRLAQLVA